MNSSLCASSSVSHDFMDSLFEAVSVLRGVPTDDGLNVAALTHQTVFIRQSPVSTQPTGCTAADSGAPFQNSYASICVFIEFRSQSIKAVATETPRGAVPRSSWDYYFS